MYNRTRSNAYVREIVKMPEGRKRMCPKESWEGVRGTKGRYLRRCE